ncbi:MAG: DUF1799 domain-containing protein [Burkholderiaceae bacterium]
MPPDHARHMRAQAYFDAWPSYIWPENKIAVQVYELCQWSIPIGMGGAWYQGISATEIHSACALVGVKRADRLDTAYRVRCMVGVAQPIYQATVKK